MRAFKGYYKSGKLISYQICTFYALKPEYADLDPTKYPNFLCLMNILETLCSNPVIYFGCGYVSENNVRYLIARDNGFLNRFYEKKSTEEAKDRWPNFSYFGMLRIEQQFYAQAGLVHNPNSPMNKTSQVN